MSIRLRFILFLCVLAGLGWVGRIAPELWETVQARKNADTDLTDSRRSTAYILDTAHELRFELPPQAVAVRVLTNLNVERADLETGDEGGRYRLGYEVRDDDDSLLLSGDYHKPVSVTRYQDLESAGVSVLGRSFYLGSSDHPLDVQTMRLKLAGLESEPASLRLRLLETPPRTHDVAVRIFVLQSVPRSQQRQRFQWQRLNPQEKARRAQANVYPYRLLTSTEERDLVERVWTPLAPVGIEGDHYASRDLYLRVAVGPRIHEGSIPPQGLLVDASSRGVFWVPQGTTRVRIEPVEPAPAGQPGPVRFWWQDSLTQRQQELTRAWAPQIDLQLGAGLLELNTPVASFVRAYQLIADEERELEPTLGLVRYYPATATTPVEYDVEHIGTAATPFRVDLRMLADGEWDHPSRTERARVHYQALNQTGAVVARGTLDHAINFSRYDHARVAGGLRAATEKSSFFLALPGGVKRLAFRAETGTVLIAGFNRPSDLPRTQRIPEETAERRPQDLPPPVWFAVRPRTADLLRERDQSLLVYFQERPEEQNPDILAGDYFWEDFQPEGDWRGRYLLVPREETAQPRDTREQALATTYTPIISGRETEVLLASRFLAPTVEPTLLYFRENRTQEEVVVHVDGDIVSRRSLGDRSGELRLPPLPPGRHVIRIQSDRQSTWFLNHGVGSEDVYVRRLAIRLPEAPLLVWVDKTTDEEELLSFRLFLPPGSSERTPVGVRLVNPPARTVAPRSAWTFADRVYDLRPAGSGEVRVLETPGETVDLGRRFFFLLGNDLPPGRYGLEVTVAPSSAGYLTLTRTLPGEFEERHVFDD